MDYWDDDFDDPNFGPEVDLFREDEHNAPEIAPTIKRMRDDDVESTSKRACVNESKIIEQSKESVPTPISSILTDPIPKTKEHVETTKRVNTEEAITQTDEIPLLKKQKSSRNVGQQFWLYSVACTPTSNNDAQFRMLLFCLDAQSNTHVLQVTDYQTSILLEPDATDMRRLKGDVAQLKNTLSWRARNLVSFIKTWDAVKLIGFTNSEPIPVLQLYLYNERDRKDVRNALKFNKENPMHIGNIPIKQFLHTRRSPETQFLFDSGLKLNSWFEAAVEDPNPLAPKCFDSGVIEHLTTEKALRLMTEQAVAPAFNKMYMRIYAHSSTATTTNQFDPSSDIPEDEVRYIGYSLSGPEEKEPHIMDIADFGNSEKDLLFNFGRIVEQSNTHAFVIAADERTSPNCMVYLFRRAQKYGINLHFAKLHSLEINCELKSCGKNSEHTYLVFNHWGTERAEVCAILAKAQTNPPLDEFTIIGALRHPELIRDKKPFAKMLHLNYHGLNSFSSKEHIYEDLSMQVALLKSVEVGSEFTAAQANIGRICDLDLTSVCERGQQARVANLWARAYYNATPLPIVINDEQVKQHYVVLRKPNSESSYPDPPWLINPSHEDLKKDTPPRHIIRQPLPNHLKHLVDLPHNNVFEIPIQTQKQASIEEGNKLGDEFIPSNRSFDDINNENSNHAFWSGKRKSSDFDRKAKKRKIVVSKKRYSGGYVYTPEPHFYTLPEEAAPTFDFASLYPSIIEAFLLCYMRIIYDRKWLTDPNLEVEYVPLSLDEVLVLAKNYRGPDGVWRPVQTITPAIVHDIVKLRKDIRTAQKAEIKGSFKWNTMERAQLAAKVVQNSVYGYIGSDSSGMTCTALAVKKTPFSFRCFTFLLRWLFLGKCYNDWAMDE